MANNLRKFETEAAYSAATLVKPAVSLIASNDAVHFDQKVSMPYPSLNGFDIAIEYQVSDATNEVQLYNASYGGSDEMTFTDMEVDGVSVTPSNTYRFSTTGAHIVRYKLPSDDMNLISHTFTDSDSRINHYNYAVVGEGVRMIENAIFVNFTNNGIMVFYSVNPTYIFGSEKDTQMTNASVVYVPSSVVSDYEAVFGDEWENIQANPYE